jgi:4-diphosphocytidyl-2-C-methyl-D-erythritol kinase
VIAVRAFAKINLSLRVGPAREDGFHDVRTILQSIDVADRLVCDRRRGPFELVCSAPGVPADRTNLVWIAAQRLWEAAGREGPPRDVRITLEKRIPAKAGLGGGSSDAAAALRALMRAWKLTLADHEVHAVAAKLGSDVPFFFIGGTALGLGRGEEVYPLDDLPRLWVLLIFPPFGVATGEAYRWMDEMRVRHVEAPRPSYLERTWLGRVVPLVNDLEPGVVERHPVVATLKERLLKAGAAMASMSGSGSTVFGVFTSRRAADAAARKLKAARANVLLTRFRPRGNR